MGTVFKELYKRYQKNVLTASEVAAELGITVQTLRRRCKVEKMIKPIDENAYRPEWLLKDIAKYLGDTDDKNDN